MEKIVTIFQKCIFLGLIFWLKFIFLTSFKSIKITDKLPAILIANHLSSWDPLLIASAMGGSFLKRPWRIPASPHLFKNFLLSCVLKSVGVYPLYKTGKIETSLTKTINYLNHGYSIIYFPEGERVLRGEIVEPKKGIDFLVKKINAEILPIQMEYKGFKPWRAKINFGATINTDKFHRETALVHKQIMTLIWRIK